MGQEPEITLVPKPQIEPIWAVAANIIPERPYGPGGAETRKGTNKFRAGQKVYLYDVYWGMGGENSTYIGRYRGKYNYITCSIPTAFVTNFRAELIYSPTIIYRIVYGYADNPDDIKLTPERVARASPPLDGSDLSRQKAETLAINLNAVSERERQLRLARIQRHQELKIP